MTGSTILVATDFSSRADRAIDRGIQLARDTDRPLRFLHACEPGRKNAPDQDEVERLMVQCVGYPAGTDLGGGEIEFAYPQGSAPAAIAEACDAQDAAILLIGPARYNSIGDYFLGTAVDHVLRNTQKPVLVVKKRVRDAYTHIVAGTDFSPGSAHAIIAAAQMFPDAHVHVAHAWHVPFEGFQRDGHVAEEVEGGDAEQLGAFMKELAGREPRLSEATTGMVRGGAFDAVKDGLKNYPDALVVLGSHGETGFRQATLGSNTSDMLRFLDADVLVVNTKAAEE